MPGYMPKAAAPTESWMQRSPRLCEFEQMKASVKRLERSAREQLVLENETQHIFEGMGSDVERVKQSVTTLATVVDAELDALRKQISKLKAVVTASFASMAGRPVADPEVEAARTREVELTKTAIAELKEHVAVGIESLRHELRQTNTALGGLRKGRAATMARLELELSASRRENAQLAERLEALGGEHRALVSWSAEAKRQLLRLTELDDLGKVVRASEAQVAELMRGKEAEQGRMAVAHEELARGRESLQQLAERVTGLEGEQRQTRSEFERRLAEAERRGDGAGSAIESIRAECRELRGAAQQLERDLSERRDEGAKLAQQVSQQAERAYALEDELSAHKQMSASAGAEVRQLQLSSAQATAALDSHRASTRRALDEMQRELGDQKSLASSSEAGMRALKLESKETVEALGAHRSFTRAALDEVDKQHDSYNHAIRVFSDALKVVNPTTARDSDGVQTPVRMLGGRESGH